MAVEIERKYRISHYDKKKLPKHAFQVVQGYLTFDPVTRIRIVNKKEAIVSIKGKGLLQREEWEFNIPLAEGRKMLRMCRYQVHKTRYVVGRVELDVFHGKLKGLVIAEIELKSVREKVKLPDWLEGVEVTSDTRYQNNHLSRLGSLRTL